MDLKMAKNPFEAWAIAFGTSKIDPSQNQDLSISLERPYKKLLNALISFEICYSKLDLWAIERRTQKKFLYNMGSTTTTCPCVHIHGHVHTQVPSSP